MTNCNVKNRDVIGFFPFYDTDSFNSVYRPILSTNAISVSFFVFCYIDFMLVDVFVINDVVLDQYIKTCALVRSRSIFLGNIGGISNPDLGSGPKPYLINN